MTPPESWLLVQALREPESSLRATPATMGLLLRQARACGLLGRLAHRVGRAHAAAGRPVLPAAQAHFDAALRLQRAQEAEILREAGHLRRALATLGAPVVVLKGAAYVLRGLPAGEGRLFSDIDIMVPKQHLGAAESLLMQHGWLGTHHNAYDQRYYREWMHELPPMEHVHRHTVLDVHHTILPETARMHPDAQALFADATALPAHPGLLTLSLPDMVLHSMTHLFMNDELSHALRDLSDIDALLRHASGNAGFWDQLAERARRHQLARVLHHGLRYAARVFATPVPAGLVDRLPGAVPGRPLQSVLDALWHHAFDPTSPPGGSAASDAAALALFVRGHWLRMPPLLLVRHLGIKALGLGRTDKTEPARPGP